MKTFNQALQEDRQKIFDWLKQQPEFISTGLFDTVAPIVFIDLIDRYFKQYIEANTLQAPRWVKASEPPKVFGMYHVTLEDGDKNRMGGFIEFNEERGWLTGDFGDDVFVTEYLDESTPTPEQKEVKVDVVSERLRGAMDED
jgi:hypothetical protein